MKKVPALVATLALIPFAVLVTGCEVAKSADPLSPSVAGPIPGVAITQPKALEPLAATKIAVDKQPVTLLIENASSNGPRPLHYVFEVATDANFTNKVFMRDSVTPGDGGRTSLRLPDPLATGRTYYWRSRAEDGANTGPYTNSTYFDVFTPIIIEAPGLIEPAPNSIVSSLQPRLFFAAPSRSGPVGQIVYTIELSLNFEFTNRVGVWQLEERGASTRFDVPVELKYNTVYYWRVRASDSTTTGPLSNVLAFATIPEPPPPPPPSGGGGGGPVGDWRRCGSTPGEAIVRCVHGAVNPSRTPEGAFEVTKRVAWLLRGSGVGLLIKNGGENVVAWQGKSFAAARICYPDGHIYKVLSDVPATNGPSWQDNDFVDRSLYHPALDPGQ